MRYYATTTSERASNSQGGNQQLHTNFLVDAKQRLLIATVALGIEDNQYVALIGLYNAEGIIVNTIKHRIDARKGEKQKTATIKCPKCKNSIWDIARGSKLNKCHQCGLAFD